MKIKFKSSWKRIFLFLSCGIVTVALSFIIGVNSSELVELLMGASRPGPNNQQAIARSLLSIMIYLPCIALGLILIIDVIKARLDRFLPFFAGVVLAYLSIFIYIFGGPTITYYLTRREFNSADWKNEVSDRENPVRLRMVEDLLDRYSLVGMSKSEIDTLLGVAGPSLYFKGYDYVYWLGPEISFISLDSEWLALKMENDTIIEARILRD